MKNKLIREALKQNNIKHWELADLLGIREENLSRKLRYELPIEEQKRIILLIEQESMNRLEQNHNKR